MSVFAEPAGSGAEDNLFSADAFLQSYFREDASRPGTFTNGGVTTGSETFETAGLTTHYTFSGHVKVVKIGTQPWNGIRIIIGASAAGTDKLVVTKSMDTRLEFKGGNVGDATYRAVRLPLADGTEFDYRVERDGSHVLFYLNDALQADLSIDPSLDTFSETEGYNLGFEASDCHLEISNIVVTCPDVRPEADTEPGTPDEPVNLFDPDKNFTGLITETVSGVYSNGEVNSVSETFFCPYLSTDFTYGAHIRIVEIGSQSWNGVRIVFGQSQAGSDMFLLTKDWGTRLDLCGDNMNDAFYERVRLPLKPGTEFDFKVERKGASVTLYLNGTAQCRIELDDAHDAFDPDGAYNLGFAMSDCHFEAEDIYVFCADAERRIEEESEKAAAEASTKEPAEPGTGEELGMYGQTVTHLTATDALDRTTGRVDGFRNDKYVGLFYFTWFNSPVAGQKQVHDITRILPDDADELFSITSKKYPLTEFYYFNEPLYGYYSSTDEYVIRKHLELFIAADVDFLALDFTNAIYYGEALQKMLDIYLEYQQAGWKVPQFLLFTNLQSGTIITQAYKQFYNSGKYDSLWFRADGSKPYVIGWENELGPALQDYFTVRPPQWPNAEYMENGWPYVDLKKPQPVYADNLMSASVAQHSGDAFSFSVRGIGGQKQMSQGRGYTRKKRKNGNVEAIVRGDNLQEEFDTAIEKDAKILFVTGWNEWIAQKLTAEWSDVAFWVDTFNTEFSRDIEMTKSAGYVSDGNGGYTEEGYGDNFYIQLVSNIRRFKGIEADPARSDDKVGYTNIALSGYGRDSYGIITSEDCYYTQAAPDNFVRSVTVDHDDKSLFMTVTCAEDIKELSAGDTLNVLIGLTGSEAEAWEHFNFKVCGYADGSASLMAVKDGGWSETGRVSYTVSGSSLSLTLPRDAIGASGSFDLYFKVTDSIEKPDEVLDYYVSGCSAPLGRLAYTYTVIERETETETEAAPGTAPETEPVTVSPATEPATDKPAGRGCRSSAGAAAVLVTAAAAVVVWKKKED